MQKNKKKIAIFTDWFLPGYKAGGPVTSIHNLTDHLNNDFHFYIITSNKDLGDKKPYPNIISNKWLITKKYKIIYLSPNNQTISNFKKIIYSEKFDTLYYNSLFSIKFTILPLLIFKRTSFKPILSPRGMLGSGAINIKPLKKKIFLRFSKLIKLYKGITWHATNEEEKSNICEHFGNNAKVITIPNIPIKVLNNQTRQKKTPVKFCFYSRISHKKNLLFALKLLKTLNSTKKLEFDIIGPIENKAYWNKCLKEISLMPPSISVNYTGTIKPTEVIKTLSQYHFLFLPTKHENFGHSIFEAFASGCPVIISNKTNWQNLEQKGIGWDINLDSEKNFITALNYCLEMSEKNYKKMSENAFNFARNYLTRSSILQQYINLFNNEYS